MKKVLVLFAVVAMLMCSISSCATIFGGTTYTAKIVAKDHPNATIKVNGETKGVGTASFEWQRSQADRLSVTLIEAGCEEQIKNFNTKNFRFWPFIGNLILPSSLIGFIVDVATQSVWKPNTDEEGVSKINIDTFLYEIVYDKCPPKENKYNMVTTETDNSIAY